jgi:hypothetical protein
MKALRALWKMLLVVPCLTILFTPALRAQLYSGRVTGVVTDQTGAVVPDATCHLVDEGKGYSFNAVTDSTGSYLMNSIPPGAYRLTVESKGFRSQTQSGILINVNQNVTVNVSLQVGPTTQSVEVTAQAPLLQAQDAATGQVVNRQFLNDIPLVTRSLTDLAFLTPGITEVDPSCSPDYVPQGNSGGECPVNNFISSGSRGASADFLLDGVTSSTFEAHGNIVMPMYNPSLDAVQEFNVQSSNFSAEYGFSGSTIVNMIIRSGTNQFHGSAYEFWRNSALDANNFFNNAAGVPLPPLKLNNFGATIGGPIRKDKTFFFADYDGLRESLLYEFTAGVPTAAEKTGDFGELCGYAGGTFNSAGMCSAPAGQLWDPYTGVYSSAAGGPIRSGYIPFNNMITYTSPGNPNLNGTGYQLVNKPGNLIDPIAIKFMQYFPAPNYKVGTPAYNPYVNWFRSKAAADHNNQFDIKVDQRWNEKDLTAIKYSQGKNGTPPLNCYDNVADGCDFGAYSAGAHLFALNHTHSFSPSKLMTLTFGVSRGTIVYTGIAGHPPYNTQNVSPSNTLGLPTYMDRSGVPQLPAVRLSGYAGAASGIPTLGPVAVGTQPYCCAIGGMDAYDLMGSLTWVKGKHSFKFGAEGRMHRMNYVLPGDPVGEFDYDFTGTSEYPSSGGGDAMATFATGVGGPYNYGAYEVPLHTSTQTFQYAAFIQDDFKATHKLTLNLGFRWEINTPQSERYNRMNYFEPNVVSPLQTSLGTIHGGEEFVSPSHRNQYELAWKNVGPRIGFAYAMNDKTVIRGGYGIYYIIGDMGASGTTGFGFQGFDQWTPWLTSYHHDNATPWGRFSDPWPITGPRLPAGNSLGLLNDVGFNAAGPIPNLDSVTPYEQTWTFGVQREFKGILVDATYVGKKGTHLLFPAFQNQDFIGPQIESYTPAELAKVLSYVPNPFYGIITDLNSPLAASTVPAWQLQLPFPQFTAVNSAYPPIANASYNALQTKLEKRFSHGLQFLVTYTWSKSIDDASGTQTWMGGLSTLQDPNNAKLERSLSSFDLPNVFQFSYTYELPVGRGKAFGSNMNPILNAIIGGWQTNGTWRFADGRPITLFLQGGLNFPTYGAQRPNLVGTLTCNTSSNLNDRLTQYFANPQVVVTPVPFTEGTAPRALGSCRQPGQANANLSLFKEFPINRLREGSRLEFRFETYNALNHPQFGSPNTTLNSGSFGLVTNQVNQPRAAQIALKFYW